MERAVESPPTPPGRLRRYLRRGLLALVSLLLALGLAEGALRVLDLLPYEPPPLYPGDRVAHVEPTGLGIVDPDIGWRFSAHASVPEVKPEFSVTYQCNAEGFRSPREFDADPELPRIVFVGDSFTLGTGVEYEQTFVHRVEQALGEVRCLDLGMAGFGIDQMWRTLHHHGLPRRPVLVVCVFVIDDLDRSLTAYREREQWIAKPAYTLVGGELVPMDESNRPGPITSWLRQELQLAQVARGLEDRLGRRWPIGPRWRLNRALFAAMRDECAAAGVPLAVAHLPQRGAWRPVPAFGGEFDELGIPFLDLGSLPAQDDRSLYFAQDPHINALGHAFVADALLAFLEPRGLLPAPR